MITSALTRLSQRAARHVRPRPLPDIVDFLEGRTTDRDGAAVGPLQLIDKDAAYRGPFNTENCPDIREILRSAVSRTTRITIIVGPTQSFKTTILIGVVVYTIAVDHGPVGHVLPNEQLARAFSTKRFQPIVENTPWLHALKVANPDLYKTLELGFTTCTVRFAGSNSPANLASFPYRRVIGDETDKFPQSIGEAAGTRELLQQRTGQFTNFNIIDASSPTVAWGTIWKAALSGTCERYYVPCPHPTCGKFFTHRFTTDRTTLVWDENAKHPNGTWDLDRVAASAHYRCPHCAGAIYENHRRDMLHAGEWRPDPKDAADAARADYDIVANPDCRSFFRSCFNVLHPQRSYAAIAVKFLLCGRDRSKLQTFWNDELGEVWEETGETADADVLYKRREDYLSDPKPQTDQPRITQITPINSQTTGPLSAPSAQSAVKNSDSGSLYSADRTLPEEIRVLTAAVDVQESPARIEYEIVGWGPGFESWGVHFGIVEKRTTWEATFAEADRQMMQTWRLPVPSGGYMALQAAAICWDTGHATEDVYKWVKKCQPRRVYAIKGDSEGYGSPLVHRPQKSGVKQVVLYMIGTITAKLEIYSRLRLTEPGPGYCHFPQNPRRGYDREFFRQLTAEKAVKRRVGGRDVYKFTKPGGRRNEALDLRCYNRAALHLLDPNFDKIETKIAAATQQLDLPAAPSESESNPQTPEISQKETKETKIPETNSSSDRPSFPSLPSVQKIDSESVPSVQSAVKNSYSEESTAPTFDPTTGRITPAETAAQILTPSFAPRPAPPSVPSPENPADSATPNHPEQASEAPRVEGPPEASPRANTYEVIGGPPAESKPRPEKKKMLPRRKGAWATRW